MGCVAPKTMIRDACVVGVALVMVYLLNGTYAHFVCNVCTTVPAFILTFIHLADYGKRLFAYKATLFYWVMNGFLLLSDSVFADSYGYFFGKFLLLSSLLFNFLYQNQVGKRAHERIQRNAHKATSQMSVATAISPADVLKFDEVECGYLEFKNDRKNFKSRLCGRGNKHV
ncbi:unnamed protein product [Toxocara canis]|uniref:YgjV family protein n=1 Tax=Toxocara canis TaxID=6265 RepID=A0A183V8Y9_TOXCA|nr:unnamed protein product [Toxocara canis]